MPDAPSSRSSRTDWLTAGLALLAEVGDRGLTVDAMCQRMGLTKGSFYHHFGGREDFVRQLLAHWEQTHTQAVITDLEPLGSPRARLRRLGERTVRTVDLRLERTIRMWGDRESEAAAVLARVDRAREEYLFDQFLAVTGDPDRARLAARAHLALLVGTEVLYQDLSRPELAALNAFVDHLGLVFPSAGSPPTKPETRPPPRSTQRPTDPETP